MVSKKLNFEDIMQSKILYYDIEAVEACLDICNTLKINFLPDYDSKHYYELLDNNFIKKPIHDAIKVNVDDKIFNKVCVDKFINNDHNVLFVFSGKVLKGIVHYADYNRNIVLSKLQIDVLNFEQNLRELLVLNNKSNDDIIDFFKHKLTSSSREREIEHYRDRLASSNKNINTMSNVGPFQMFNLSDLIDYTSSSFSDKILSFNKHQDLDSVSTIKFIRNMAMHGKNPIEIDNETSIYSIESLKKLSSSIEVLEHYSHLIDEKINENSDYVLTKKLENINKLNIIHKHHPNSLKYFLS